MQQTETSFIFVWNAQLKCIRVHIGVSSAKKLFSDKIPRVILVEVATHFYQLLNDENLP